MKQLLLALLCAVVLHNAHAQVVINEYSAANLSSFLDDYQEHEDWIEIYNSSAAAVNLQNWYLSDDEDKPLKWQIPGVVNIPASGYAVFFCSGRGTGKHTSFKISQTDKNPGKLMLSNPQGSIVDSRNIKKTQVNHSRGRISDGGTAWEVFTQPTPGANNGSAPYYTAYADRPNFDLAAGFYSDPQQVTITNNETNAVVRYTTDGTAPTPASPAYTSPISITKTTVLKAAAFSNDPKVLPGFIEFATYFVGENHGLVVLSVAADSLQDLANGNKDIRPVGSIEYFGLDKTRTARSYGELNSHGQDSWVNDQRSIDWISRDEMGYSKAVNEKIFSLSDRDEFQRFILRAAGDDNYPNGSGTPGGGAHLRDAYIQNLSKIHGLHLDVRTGEKAIVYLNGDYWGVYDLREKPDDSDYTNHYYDQGKYDIQYLKTWGNTWAEYGGQQAFDDWRTTQDFILDNDMSVQANFDSAASMLNVRSLADYLIVQSATVCSDWLNYNVGWWRGTNPEGKHKKWGFILWDNDATFGYYINYTGIPNTKADADPCDIDVLEGEVTVTFPGFDYILQPGDTIEWEGVLYLPGDTIMVPEFTESFSPDLNQHMKTFLKLRENPEYDRYYITRYADLMNTMFSCDNMLGYLASQYNLIKPEMGRHIARWGGTVDEWEGNYEAMRSFIEERCVALEEGMRECFSLSGPYTASFDVDPPGQGEIEVNSLKIKNFPYTGKYYGGIENRLEANVTDPLTYKFSNWETTNTSSPGSSDVTFVNFSGDAAVVAHFVKISSSSTGPLSDGYALKVQPSVFSEATRILIDLPTAEDLQVSLYNAFGQQVQDLLPKQKRTAGQHTLDVDFHAAGLPSGTYLIHVQTEGGFVQAQRVIFVK
jgi:hypothetical protein